MTELGESLERIKALLDLMRDNDLAELELEEGGVRVALRRSVPGVVPAAAPAVPVQFAPAGDSSAGLEPIKSPIVGTFYRGPSPDAAPFVGEGDTVRKGAVVCIIEAMKIMNDIKSDLDGKIERVLVESGEPVEYGQPLFLIRRG
ncbi:MAG: acetyl-CoA carboxylase biotin carboxyl carrier protein [Planctomycetota bacterium]|jgi:acetyl-CoA carboxylase biotin carboxyl carrier protein|nr:acetyl-CoA carboxylase biotin carboxyl carrier protein [Planctomycetota bacterium]